MTCENCQSSNCLYCNSLLREIKKLIEQYTERRDVLLATQHNTDDFAFKNELAAVRGTYANIILDLEELLNEYDS